MGPGNSFKEESKRKKAPQPLNSCLCIVFLYSVVSLNESRVKACQFIEAVNNFLMFG
jgi:hypothetical protein